MAVRVQTQSSSLKPAIGEVLFSKQGLIFLITLNKFLLHAHVAANMP